MLQGSGAPAAETQLAALYVTCSYQVTQVRSLQCHSEISLNILSFNFAIKHLQLVLNSKELFSLLS